MNFKNLFRKKNSLAGKFTLIISMAIFTSLIFMLVYNFYSTFVLINQNNIDKKNNYENQANFIVQNLREDLKLKNYTNLDKISSDLIKTNLVLFIKVIDKESGKTIWSSKNIHNEFSSNILEIRKNADKFVIFTGFHNDDTLIVLTNILLKGNLFFILIFVILGFLSASIMAKSVTKPINDLVLSSKEFSKGNFKHRIKILAQDEINLLVDSFNDMAEKLECLYSSLEQRVKDRTIELEKAYNDLKEMQTMLVHNEKMNSLGQLVAGIAHELNNPINFIYGNLDHLKNYSDNLVKIIQTFDQVETQLSVVDLDLVQKIKNDLEYDYIVEDLPSLLRSCKEGTERCKQIIIDLKNFSRLDEASAKEADIQEGIESTLNILHNKLKYKITLHKEYDNIPKIHCYPGQLNQVFMNILDNAIQAIEGQGDIYIKTRFEDNNVVIIFEDNGSGIDNEHINRIFDPFYTTKPVGEGTGLGLSISYKIIKSHNGTIEVESEKGKGTKFIIKIPSNWEMKKN